MAKYEKSIQGNFTEVVSLLNKDILDSGLSMNLVDESSYAFNDFQLLIRVYDKYFARTGSRTSLSLVVAGQGNEILITAIGAGGGKGVILNMSWGAEEELVSVVVDSIEAMLKNHY